MNKRTVVVCTRIISPSMAFDILLAELFCLSLTLHIFQLYVINYLGKVVKLKLIKLVFADKCYIRQIINLEWKQGKPRVILLKLSCKCDYPHIVSMYSEHGQWFRKYVDIYISKLLLILTSKSEYTFVNWKQCYLPPLSLKTMHTIVCFMYILNSLLSFRG